MSRVVVIEKNKSGKIELTKEELQKMLDDAYYQGYTDGKGKYETITYPSYYPWYVNCSNSGAITTAASSDSVTLNSTEVKV